MATSFDLVCVAEQVLAAKRAGVNTMHERPLVSEFNYFLEHRKELADRYPDRVIVIVDQSVVGDYDTELTAFRAASAKYRPGTFLVQRCSQDPSGFTASYYGFHIRVPCTQ